MAKDIFAKARKLKNIIYMVFNMILKNGKNKEEKGQVYHGIKTQH
jgi:hypothetical protein